MSPENTDVSVRAVVFEATPEEVDRLEKLVVKIEHLKALGWDPAELGDPKVFAKIGPDGRLIAIRADIKLEEKLGHLYSLQGKTSITAAGFARINSITAINVISPSPPKFITDPETGRLKAVDVRKMAIGFSPSGSLMISDASLHFDLDAYRLHELANLVKKRPGAVKFVLKEELDGTKLEGKLGWVVPYEDPVMIWADIKHEDVRDLLIADSQRRKFAERIAGTIAWRNAVKTHAAIAQAQVQAAGSEGMRTASVRVFGFRHDLDHAALSRLAAGIVEGKLDVVKEQLRTIPGATQEIKIEQHASIAEADDVASEVGAVIEEEGISNTDTVEAAPVYEPQEERERLYAEVQEGAAVMNDQNRLSRLMADAGITDAGITNLKNASVSALRYLTGSISKEVDVRATDNAKSKGPQSPKP